ncbi:MAG: transposase [Candidatus Moduliflexus flocculans]|nr:transposase [Candidatus Moduliflexus flocculans]
MAGKALKTLLAANKRLNTAYLLKESFGQLWELRTRGLGAALLRELAREPEVAAPRALREVRRDDRSSLGWNRRLLQTREQGVARLRRGAQQQDPRHPAPCVRTAR